ncbi:hypothetical protein MKY85_00270 [Paenibacillus sp. FSL R5-0749]|uniref:hypothetical protein n=1 Tax=Paenibacillus sp. FSL R5-0749 TaxID=2921657 RepID=UPI00315A70F1
MKILKLDEILNQNMDITKNIINDSFVFVEQCDYSIEADYYFKSLLVLDTNEIRKYSFPYKTRIVNSSASGSNFYYGTIEKKMLGSEIIVNKLDLKSFEDSEVGRVKVDIASEDDLLHIALNSRLIGLNERHCILLTPQQRFSSEGPFYSHCYLLDFKFRQVSAIQIPKKEYLQIEDIFVYNNGQDIIMKTGRIESYEKESFWEQIKANQMKSTYFDSSETLLHIKTNSLINNVENNEELSCFIIDEADYQSSLTILSLTEEKLIYTKKEFLNSETYLAYFDLRFEEVFKNEIKDPFDYIFYEDDQVFIIQYVNEQLILLNGNKVNCIKENSNIVSINSKNIIEFEIDSDYNKFILIYDRLTSALINKIRVNRFHYESQRRILISY